MLVSAHFCWLPIMTWNRFLLYFSDLSEHKEAEAFQHGCNKHIKEQELWMHLGFYWSRLRAVVHRQRWTLLHISVRCLCCYCLELNKASSWTACLLHSWFKAAGLTRGLSQWRHHEDEVMLLSSRASLSAEIYFVSASNIFQLTTNHFNSLCVNSALGILSFLVLCSSGPILDNICNKIINPETPKPTLTCALLLSS